MSSEGCGSGFRGWSASNTGILAGKLASCKGRQGAKNYTQREETIHLSAYNGFTIVNKREAMWSAVEQKIKAFEVVICGLLMFYQDSVLYISTFNSCNWLFWDGPTSGFWSPFSKAFMESAASPAANWMFQKKGGRNSRLRSNSTEHIYIYEYILIVGAMAMLLIQSWTIQFTAKYLLYLFSYDFQSGSTVSAKISLLFLP